MSLSEPRQRAVDTTTAEERGSVMRLNRKLAAVLAAGGMMVGVGVVGAGPAEASAYGCTGYGTGVTVQGVYVKNGTWCGGVVGSGTYVNYLSGNFYNHIPYLNSVCNFALRADFYDSSGNWYAWGQTGTSYRCSSASDLPNLSVYNWARRGFVRITLLSNGGTVAAVQENIS